MAADVGDNLLGAFWGALENLFQALLPEYQ